jgi:hypothetical protein
MTTLCILAYNQHDGGVALENQTERRTTAGFYALLPLDFGS